jgi:hypothetical protein
MANFAPYQDVPPERERERALSPQLNIRSPTLSPRPEQQRSRNIGTAAAASPIASPQPNHGGFFPANGGWSNTEDQAEQGNARPSGFGGGRGDVDLFETSLGIRMDWEACLAYLALPPLGPVVLLIMEHKSDYVRYVTAGCVRSSMMDANKVFIGSMHGSQHFSSRSSSWCTSSSRGAASCPGSYSWRT